MKKGCARETLPATILAVLRPFADAFSARVWEWAKRLVVGAILAPGQRPVTAILRVLGHSDDQQFQHDHRVLNRARWSSRALSRILLLLLLAVFVPPDQPVVVGLVETIERRRGAKIAAKGIYRDPVRSSKRHFVKTSGLPWMAMMALTTRAAIAAAADCSVVPLPQTGQTAKKFATWVDAVVDGAQPDELLWEGARLLGAGSGFERKLDAVVDGETVAWAERVQLIHSPSLATRQQASLATRLTSAQAALLALTPAPGRGKRQIREEAALEAGIAAVVERHDMAGLLAVRWEREEHRQTHSQRTGTRRSPATDPNGGAGPLCHSGGPRRGTGAGSAAASAGLAGAGDKCARGAALAGRDGPPPSLPPFRSIPSNLHRFPRKES
ncbi:MAG: transposase [Dehalococcoidia bacterium]